MSVEAVTRTLADAGVRYAVIGAVALAARGASRSTLDFDLLVGDGRVLHDEFWKSIRDTGTGVEIRKGDLDDPLAGVVRVAGSEPVDVIVVRYRWQKDIVEHAEPVVVRGLTLPIARTADLVLLKLFAGGYRDVQDVRTLLHVSDPSLVSEVAAALEELPAEMRERWSRLLSEAAT
jgi:predicted nucleotidyltransferase